MPTPADYRDLAAQYEEQARQLREIAKRDSLASVRPELQFFDDSGDPCTLAIMADGSLHMYGGRGLLLGPSLAGRVGRTLDYFSRTGTLPTA